MRADFSTTRPHAADRIPTLLRAALALAASALALCVTAGCIGSTSAFHTCDNCKNSYNGGHVEQASCGHWFCDMHDECKGALEEHEALAKGAPALECGTELHYRCDGRDHSQAACGTEGHFACRGAGHGVPACGIEGHLACDGLPHTLAVCMVDGHFDCDGADHSTSNCIIHAARPSYVNPPASSHYHFGGEATCLKQAACESCGKPYGPTNPLKHDASCAYKPAAACGHVDHDSTCMTGGPYHNKSACSCGDSCSGGDNVSSNGETSWVPCPCGCWVEAGCNHAHDASCGYSAGVACSAA